MSALAELFDIRDKILLKLIEDPEVINALKGTSLNTEITDPSDILYKNIFPYKKMIDIETHKENYITMDYSAFGLVNNHFKDFSITFYIIVNEEFALLDYENNRKVLRMDFLSHKIDSIFNNSRGFGVGKLSFNGLKSVEAPDGFIIQAIIYTNVDFN